MNRSVSAATASVNDTLLGHLREQYDGVLDEAGIQRHVRDYVDVELAGGLVDMVLRQAGRPRKLLDVGSGYGSFVLGARERGVDACGIELAPFEVGFARERLRRVRPDDDEMEVYREGSALELPWRAGEFDVVTLWNVLEHVPDGNAALAEAIRVLAPGGFLYVICPNYAAFRSEAHYHVFWPSLLPRRAAAAYLRWRGRNPEFFARHVFYRTNAGVTRFLRRRGLRLFDLRVDRFDNPGTINNARVRQAFLLLQRTGLLRLAKILLQLALLNPFKSSIALYARKPADGA